MTDEEDSAFGRTIVHCMRTFTGADWDLNDALALVGRSERIRWVDNPFAHELQVWVDGQPYHFNARRPT